MRKIVMLLGVFVALAIPVAALAATLDTSKFTDSIDNGDKCAKGAFYHIVHPGPDGGADGIVTVVFTDGVNDVTKTENSYQSPGRRLTTSSSAPGSSSRPRTTSRRQARHLGLQVQEVARGRRKEH